MFGSVFDYQLHIMLNLSKLNMLNYYHFLIKMVNNF